MRRAALAGAVGLMLASAVSAAGPTPTCVDFLKISMLPRVAALGEASVAVRDAAWADANPGNLASAEGSLLTFSHTAWFQDISLEMLAFGTSTGRHALGLALSGLHTEPLAKYSSEDVYEGDFRYFDFLVAATYAMAPAPALRLGVTGKVIYEKIDWDSATGFAADFGTSYALPPRLLRGELSAGLVARNLGTKMGYFEKKYDLPLAGQGGLAYRPFWLPKSVDALVAVDYRATRGSAGAVLVGAEFEVMKTVALRLGSRGRSGGSDATLGLGVKIKNMTLDYAYMDPGQNLGATHRISLGFKTSGILPSPEASQ
ncbi:MAG TPA: PorV/PorQ family protein [bacterium]|nr:PorV/PorQ family protein [bacterium]